LKQQAVQGLEQRIVQLASNARTLRQPRLELTGYLSKPLAV